MDQVFIEQQNARILRRISKYLDEKSLATLLQISKTGSSIYKEKSINDYINYKRQNVVPKLFEALRVINSGQYGICQKCKEPIPKKRLEIIPAATRCVKCSN